MSSPVLTKLQPIHYLQVIARAGSISSAARELGLSQPTLSNAVKGLEEELRTTLLLRRRDGVSLTTTGQELLHFAGEALRLLETAEARVQGLEQDDLGRFALGCPEVLAVYFLSGFLLSTLSAMPRVEMTIRNGPSRVMERALIDREIEFALVVNPLPHPELVLTRLFEDTTEIVGAGAVRSSRAAEARVAAGPLLFVENLPQSQHILRTLARQRVLPTRRIACGSFEVVAALAQDREAVAILPRRAAALAPGALRPLHASLPQVKDNIFLAYRADLHRTKAALRLRDAIVAEGRRYAAT